MQTRTLGNAVLELSPLGLGGFHLVEVCRSDSDQLLNAYRDRLGDCIDRKLTIAYSKLASERYQY